MEIVSDAIAYLPFGPVSALSFGNGLDLATTHDLDYRLTGITAGDGVTDIQDLSYSYDATGNITAIADAVDAARDQSLVYDALYRLTQADGDYGLIGYSYDAGGFR